MNIQGVDTTNLRKAIGLAEQYSKRTPEQAVCTAGFFIARKAAHDVTRATVSGIDSKLGVSSSLAVIPKGRRNAGKNYKNKRLAVAFPQQGLTVADSWILARMWPGSKVNMEEGHRWFIDRREMPTGGKAAFFSAIRALAQKMVASRHSSIAFLAVSARDIVKALEPRVSMAYRRNAVADDPEAAAASKFSATPKGEADVRVTGASAVMQGDLTIGGGTPDNLSEPHNEAMHRYMTPALQGAIDHEGERQLEYVAKKELEQMSGRFNAVGVRIT